MGVTGVPGDLIIKVKTKLDPYFKRKGFDICTHAFLTISQVYLIEDYSNAKKFYRLF